MARVRVRRMLKWPGLAVCAALVLVSAVSAVVNTAYYSPRRWIVGVRLAEVCVRWQDDPDGLGSMEGPPGPGWQVSRHPFGLAWRPRLYHWSAGSRHAIHQLHAPLWVPLVLIGLPTAWLWHRDRPIPPHACRVCRYDLRGITAGKCPECGAAVTPA